MTLKLKKYKFHQHESPIFIDKIDINEILVSNKVSFGQKDFKYFIGYTDAKKVRPLSIFLLKMNAYRRDFDKTKYMSFSIKDEKSLEKYNEIWKNASNIIENEFDSKPVYNEKYLKTKKSYNGKININFYNNKIPKEGSPCIRVSVMLIDSVYRKDKKFVF